MKKSLILAAVVWLSGCSAWQSWNFDWDWNRLNPWHENTQEAEKSVEKVKSAEQLPATVNKYLWQACVDKLSFMGIETRNPQEGRLITGWKSLTAAPSERFKIAAEVAGGELRADALDVKVYKEVKEGGNWVKKAASPALKIEIEQAIIKQAKILYINDKNKE